VLSSLTISFAVLAGATAAAQDALPDRELPEVRQLVVFDFLPGRTAEAIRVFREEALPLYERDFAMLRFRGFREAESPEPFDLVVVSAFHGMAGMDRSNEALVEEAARRGTSVGAIYGKIGALSEGHRDLFVEMDPRLSWGEPDDAALRVFVSIRAVAGAARELEILISERLLPWERASGLVAGTESGRYLLSAGDTHFRVLGVASLAAWHRYVRERRAQPFWADLERLIAESRQQILVPLPELSVR